MTLVITLFKVGVGVTKELVGRQSRAFCLAKGPETLLAEISTLVSRNQLATFRPRKQSSAIFRGFDI